ncbi:hypothetical protein KL933_003436 [Ogataea haglerorum]|uniref:Pre-rRNA-processing protein IPI3 n=1 Tax=Ogataea haglerorum TaxID=1937702 RepID=A0AAN6D5C5_9ASCO|nr:hypothetical protein KL950_002623 [Ogataea haglerorum]KAG7717205.1 hypothetical protein KL913_002956 [Ogataea haglerorum]KAG7719407.1 hypothetical protein KL949_002399 [Ogataea haglerorum]KAG7726505.1 hypothetical protein KL933_003436 [Ogataea haglerorum]
MDELLFYNSVGDPSKKHSTSFGFLSSIHSSQHIGQYRQCYSNINGTTLTGIGGEHKVIVACKGKALIHVYLHGKESPEQTIPLPEEVSCLEIFPHPNSERSWLLVAGAVSGRLYVWELDSGLLLAVKESHYQSVGVVKCSKGYIVSGGADSRIVVWKVLDILTDSHKPYVIFTDHTLPVTDITISSGLINDIKLWSVSADQTVRCYDLTSLALVTTFVAQQPIHSIAADPAFRCLYIGLANGMIRMVHLFQASPQTQIWEQVGGFGKIITLKDDIDLRETFTNHQIGENPVTRIAVSFDGTQIVTGDSNGRVLVLDVATKQTVRTLKQLAGPVSTLKLFRMEANIVSNSALKTAVRTIPVLKRSLVEDLDLQKHEVHRKFTDSENSRQLDLDNFLDTVKSEQMWFSNFTGVDSSVKQNKENLGSELAELRESYASMKSKYDALYDEHSKLLMNNK